MTINPEHSVGEERLVTALMAAGGLLGARGASCWIFPLVLFGLGVGGTWIGNFTRLAPYQPYFIAATFAFLGCGYWLVYRTSAQACADDQICARPLPNKLVRPGDRRDDPGRCRARCRLSWTAIPLLMIGSFP